MNEGHPTLAASAYGVSLHVLIGKAASHHDHHDDVHDHFHLLAPSSNLVQPSSFSR